MSYCGARCLYGLLELEAYHGDSSCGADRESRCGGLETNALPGAAFAAMSRAALSNSVEYRRARKTTRAACVHSHHHNWLGRMSDGS